EYIPLETNNNSLLGNIRKIFFEKSMFYVVDNNNVCKIFDRKGKYLKTIDRKGNGPEEYAQISDINVDPETGNILILERNNIKEFDISGKFIKKIESPEKTFTFFNFTILSNGLFAANISNFKPRGKEEGFLIYDSSLKIHNKITFPSPTVKPQPPTPDGAFSFVPVFSDIYRFSRCKSQVNISREFNDTVYLLNKNFSLSPLYVFDFGNFSFNKQNLSPFELQNNSPVITKSPDIHQNSDYLFLNFDLRGKAPFSYTEKARDGSIRIVNTEVKAIYSKKNGVLTLLKESSNHLWGLKDDISEGPPFWPLFVSSESDMISYFQAMDLIRLKEEQGGEFKGLSKITKDLSEGDNPVIVLVKLKK
ncbi:MAG: 6-bladed beta-propeller, partial [Bacteroidales bacterium]|nr:6-bladed beta-propeller [Bacteroidales bacterium]